MLTTCVCPGHELRLECTVVGAGITIWTGSSFNCSHQSNEITLRHSQFKDGTVSGLCNGGRITGQSISSTSGSGGVKYTSQLIIQLDVNGTLNNTTVKCLHDIHDNLIGTHTIIYTQGNNNITTFVVIIHDCYWYDVIIISDPHPPPDNVHLSEVDVNQLVFAWDPIQPACPAVEYIITSVNCGICPSATNNISITCAINNTSDTSMLCVLSVQTAGCGSPAGNSSNNITATLRGILYSYGY